MYNIVIVLLCNEQEIQTCRNVMATKALAEVTA